MRGLSPTRMALMRLAKNGLAVSGGILVALMVLFSLVGPLFVKGDATTIRLWIGAQAPGYRHPAVGSEVVLVEGELPQGIYGIARGRGATGELELHWQERERDEIRIVLRRGKIKIIQYQRDARKVKSLTIDPSHLKTEDERALAAATLEVGKLPPEWLFQEGERVVILYQDKAGAQQITKARVVDGRLSRLREEGGAISQRSLRAAYISEVRFKGKTLDQLHWLGTDELGRDLLHRIMMGGRVSLLVGVVATLVSLVIGVFYGALAGYRGGMLDRVMMGSVDILYALPFIFLVLLLMVIFERNIMLLFVALGMVQWLTMARIVRGQVLSLVQMDYIQAARMAGAKGGTILWRHLIPHTLGPVIVYTTLMVPTVILEESFLAFIGLPVQYQGTTLDSWGSLVHQGTLALGEAGEKSWLLIFPSLAMVLTLFGLNALGDGLRDAFDPKRKI